MNKFIFLSIAASLLALGACNNSPDNSNEQSVNWETSPPDALLVSNNDTLPKPADIQTNYYDLPGDKEDVFFETLAMEDNKLTESSIDIFKQFISQKLLAETNPVSKGITSNYFWYVYNALPDFVSVSELHRGYYIEGSEQDFQEQLKAYGIYRIDRSSDNLNRLFKFAKPILPVFVSPEKYKSVGIENKVDMLTDIYETLLETEDYKVRLTDAYNHADTATGNWTDFGYGPVFEPYNPAYGLDAYELSRIICEHMNYSRHHIYYGEPRLSFWMRRVHEGNAETVYELLKNIQEIYQ